MPPKTVLLAQMMRDLSGRTGFTEAVLKELGSGEKGEKKGPALLTPALFERLRELILGEDWQGLDRFPGWTMREINPTVRVAAHIAGKDPAITGIAERRPGSPASAEETQSIHAQLQPFIDLGSYSLAYAESISLNEPSPLPGFSNVGLVSTLGDGLVRGDDANPSLAPLHSESQRLADVMNRIALNRLERSATAKVAISEKTADSPEGLIQALIQSGHSVVVSDARYFANFGHFHYQGDDVMMPFWVNSGILVPGTHRPLLVPVSHAEYEWQVRGRKINADISWYFGIDGKAEFRTMDTQDQAWVLGRHAHEYHDAEALEVTRLVGLFTVAYARQHLARPGLPFGGYYALGVCQDSVAAIEKKMTGTATLFPNTAEANFFDDPRDAEVNALIAAIPKDRDGGMPGPARIFGSLPTNDLHAITIPGLADDLIATETAWHNGTLEIVDGWKHRLLRAVLWCAAAIVALLASIKLWRRKTATLWPD